MTNRVLLLRALCLPATAAEPHATHPTCSTGEMEHARIGGGLGIALAIRESVHPGAPAKP